MSQILLEAFNSIPYPTERTEKNGMMDISYTFEDETNHGYRFHFEKRVNYGRNVFVLTLGQKSPNIKMYKRVFGKFHNPLRVIATLIDIVKDNRQKRSDVKGLIIEVPEQAFGAHGRLVDKIIKRELRTELKVQDLELSIEEFEKMGLKGVVATVKPYQFDSVFNGKIMKDILDKRSQGKGFTSDTDVGELQPVVEPIIQGSQSKTTIKTHQIQIDTRYDGVWQNGKSYRVRLLGFPESGDKNKVVGIMAKHNFKFLSASMDSLIFSYSADQSDNLETDISNVVDSINTLSEYDITVGERYVGINHSIDYKDTVEVNFSSPTELSVAKSLLLSSGINLVDASTQTPRRYILKDESGVHTSKSMDEILTPLIGVGRINSERQEDDEDLPTHSQKYVAEARQFLDKAIKNELSQSDYDVTDVAFVEFIEPKSGVTLYKFRLTVKKNGKVLERQYAYVTATYAGDKVKVDRTSVVNWINSAEDKTNGLDSSQYEQTLEFKKASAESDINTVKITVLGPVPYISIERDVKIMGLVSKACREVFEDVEGLDKDGIRNNGGAQIISFVYGTKYEDLKPYIKSLVLNLKNKGVESELVGNKLDQFTFHDEVKYELLTDERYDIRLRFGTDADAKRAYGILKGAVALQYGNDTMRLYGNTISSLRANVTGRQMDAKVARIIELLGQPSVEKTNLGNNDLNDPSSPLEDARIDITVDEGNESGTAHIVFQHPSETERSGIQDAIAAIVKKVIPQARRADGSQVDDMFSMVVKGGYLTWNDKIEEIATALNDEHAEAVFHPPEVPDHIKALGDAINQHNETMTYKTKDGFVFEVNGRKLTFKADVNFNSIMDYVFGWFKSEFDTIDGKRQFVDKTNGDNLTQNFIGVLGKLSIKEAISKKLAEQFDTIISKTHREYDLSTTMYERSIGAPEGQISDYREFKGEVVVNDNGTAFAVFTSNTGPFVKSAREQFGSVDFEVNGNLNTLKVPLDGNFSIKEFDAGLVGKFLKAHDDNYGVLSKRFNPVKVIKPGRVTFQPSKNYASLSLKQDLACYLVGLEKYQQYSKVSSVVGFEDINTIEEFYSLCEVLDNYDFEGNYLKAFRCSKYISDARANGGELKIDKNGKELKVTISDDMIIINLKGMKLPKINTPFWNEGDESALLKTYYMGHKKFNDALAVLDNFLDSELQGSTTDVKDNTIADKTGVVKQDDGKTFHFEHQKGGFKIVTKSSVEQIKAFVDNTLDLSDNGDGSIFVKLSHFSQTVGTKKRVSAALVGNGFTEGEHVATPGSAAAASAKVVKQESPDVFVKWSTVSDSLKPQYFSNKQYKIVEMDIDDIIKRQADDFRVDANSPTNRIGKRVETAKEHISNGLVMDRPVVEIDANGNLQVVDGRHRLAAMKELGIKKAEVFLYEAPKESASDDITILGSKKAPIALKAPKIERVKITSDMYKFTSDGKTLTTARRIKTKGLNSSGWSASEFNSGISLTGYETIVALFNEFKAKYIAWYMENATSVSIPNMDLKQFTTVKADVKAKFNTRSVGLPSQDVDNSKKFTTGGLNVVISGNRVMFTSVNPKESLDNLEMRLKANGIKTQNTDVGRVVVQFKQGLNEYEFFINERTSNFKGLAGGVSHSAANFVFVPSSVANGTAAQEEYVRSNMRRRYVERASLKSFELFIIEMSGGRSAPFSTKDERQTMISAELDMTTQSNVDLIKKALGNGLNESMNEGIKGDLTGVAPKVNKVEKQLLENTMRQMGIYHSAFAYGGSTFTVSMDEGVVDILPTSGNVAYLSKLLGVKLGQDLVQDERGGLRFDIA